MIAFSKKKDNIYLKGIVPKNQLNISYHHF